MLSVRSRARQGFADVRARCEREPDLLQHGSGFVLYALMDAIVDRYFPVLDELEARLERVEQQIFAGAPTRANVEALYGSSRSSPSCSTRRVRCSRRPASSSARACPPSARTQEYYRDVHDHLHRINQSIDSLREMVNTAMSVNLSLISLAGERDDEAAGGLAALVAVPTLIAGLYGMNFEHMPELRWRLGYPVTVGVMVAIDVYLFSAPARGVAVSGRHVAHGRPHR